MSTETEVKLLTLLNVAAIKRPRELDVPGGHRGSPARTASVDQDGGEKVKRRKSVVFGGELGPSGSGYGKGKESQDVAGAGKSKKGKEKAINGNGHGNGNGNGNGHLNGNGSGEYGTSGVVVTEEDSEDETVSQKGVEDSFNSHFGVEPQILDSDSTEASASNSWLTSREYLRGLGRIVSYTPKTTANSSSSLVGLNRITPALAQTLNVSNPSTLVTASLALLGTYKDLYLHSLDGEADGSERAQLSETKEVFRKAIIVHSLNHVLKTRRKIIRNNEKLAHAAAAAVDNPSSASTLPDPPRDQSFTRPKVLLLLPLRSLALRYLTEHLFPLAPAGTQIENQKPFTSSFSLPSDVEDPLASATDFPIDHLVNFKGNSDDNFRIGIKITRKAWRVVMMPASEAKLMECDILIASPLGIKMTAEREGSTDLLSSIEVMVADGCDVMQMQNWDHVQFIFNNLNKIPESPHGCDFSRVKPWYLDQQAKYLRQTIIMSRYDTPEVRSLFHRHCFNVQGKVRLEKNDYEGVLGRIRPGIKQVFERFDLENTKGLSGEAAVDEVDARLQWFIKKTIPALQRSAMSRQNTIIVVPSYFDFVRVVDHFRKDESISFASISEYSSNSEISRARTLFFKGKKSFLVVTERFHFYRRYKLRGAKTIVFYALPDHAQFYSEFLQTPFLPSRKDGQEVEADVDEGEISSRVLFSRFDALKLERVVGSIDAKKMLGSGEERFTFV